MTSVNVTTQNNTVTVQQGDATTVTIATQGPQGPAGAAGAGLSDVVDDTSPQLGGDLASNSFDIKFADNDKAIFGADGDLEVFHDNTNTLSEIKNSNVNNFTIRQSTSNGFMFVHADQLQLRSQSTNEPYITCTKDGSVESYHNGSKKFQTTATGIDVTGNITATGVIHATGNQIKVEGATPKFTLIDNDNNPDYEIQNNGGTLNINDITSGTTRFTVNSNGAVELYHNNAKKLETSATGVDVTGTVDLSSAESNSSNTSQFKLSNLTIGQHQNVGSYRFANAGTGSFLFTANNINFFNKDVNKNLLRLSASGVEIYHDNVKKVETTNSGITVTGSVTTQDMNMSNLNGTANEVDNTKGSWSIQEGADDLFLINRVSGKKYKFNLTEIS